MKTQSIDTHPQAEAIQIQLIRQATVAQRIARMRSLTSSLMRLSKRAIRRANPGATQAELDVLFVKYHYGEALAVRFQAYLEQRNPHGHILGDGRSIL
jgi:2-keto-4-pentenoate hydratase